MGGSFLSRIPPVAPSVEQVLRTLYEQHPLTGQQIRERTGLPRRTVYAALQRLKGLGILHERVSLRDTKVTDDDLKILVKLPHLENLDLSHTRITGAGLVVVAWGVGDVLLEKPPTTY